DVPGRRDVPQASKRFSGGRDDVPRMAHRMADAILEFLTSERGPFDSKIAMVSTRSGRLKDVYTWTFDQDDPVRVTDERSLVIAPRWRPDARALVFASYREHFPRLFQVDVGSRQTARLVPGPGVVLDGAWSPDGTRLLVTREEGGNSDIYLLDRSGDRKSTRLNSSHVEHSYAVFCLKKKRVGLADADFLERRGKLA